MPIQLDNDYGQINVSDSCIATIAGSAAMECYGLVGMASRNGLKDGLAVLLGRDNWTKGVEIRQDQHGVYIDLYIIVSYGTKISEVASNIRSKVTYVLNDVIGLAVNEVNIFVQDVRVST
ncbi:MAG: Asp23/Gls24 family envelope stress response protein [Candidatus Pristimantibacillus lignocellulolyticus]|uniref:Asp23/Gls24 family envelope stress response protein n=1 Tax=Candidatus Pristimantibacillus lignocellulolyticus TaxID=2994561 RepID=A0A9J6ZAS9_9BACL|nr:MAG: Asp23/Gls24 family envelope stress response protein [Candidatus Pristimantibacillus lignocellulolyticus]